MIPKKDVIFQISLDEEQFNELKICLDEVGRYDKEKIKEIEKRTAILQQQLFFFTKAVTFLLQEKISNDKRPKGLLRKLNTQLEQEEEQIKEYIKKALRKVSSSLLEELD